MLALRGKSAERHIQVHGGRRLKSTAVKHTTRLRSSRKILVVTSAYARTDSGGRGREVPRQPDREWRMPSFLGGKSRGAFGQPRFSWREIA